MKRKLIALAICALALVALTGCNISTVVTNAIDNCTPRSTLQQCFDSLDPTKSVKPRYKGDTVGE